MVPSLKIHECVEMSTVMLPNLPNKRAVLQWYNFRICANRSSSQRESINLQRRMISTVL